MNLDEALKVSLDELRMQMLGAQVLLGFQFQGLFQDKFSAVTAYGRVVDAAGLGLMLAALGLMIAIPCQHRLVEGGEATQRIYSTSKRYARLALLPVAAGLGCDLFVAAEGPFGTAPAAILAALTFVLALGAWYLLGIILRRHWSVRGSEAPVESSNIPLHKKIDQMLTEARVILPGVQAMLGFQFVVMLTKSFGELPPAARLVHLVALMNIALTIILLIAPAAIHRITFDGNDDRRLHSAGSALMTAALLPLACGISCDLWVALTKLFGEGRTALVGALAAFALLVSLWYLLPLLLRHESGGQGSSHLDVKPSA